MDADFTEDVSKNEILMEEMALYAEKHDVQGMLKEYMGRLVLSKPSDPIAFLIKEIKKDPFSPPEQQLPEDLRPPSEKRKYMDARPPPEQELLLLEIFNFFRKDSISKVPKAKTLVKLRRDRHFILERFPKHFHELIRTIEMVPADSDGNMAWEDFSEMCISCLSGPGGRVL
mmetsp:Transcript_34925/g.46162  ORF Transcript_34925/g.46162 Transcript_34925/m.46162 type:complete len:172 (+) Transcript_34925:130-645(+)